MDLILSPLSLSPGKSLDIKILISLADKQEVGKFSRKSFQYLQASGFPQCHGNIFHSFYSVGKS